MWWQFWHVIKMIPDAENILNNDDFAADFVDSPKEGVEQHKKREYLRGVISKCLLRGGKKQRTYERVGKVINKTIDKVYAG